MLVGMATFSFSPVLQAQTPSNPPANPNAPDNSQASKTTDSTADQSQTGGTPTDSGSLQRNDSKNGPASLDNNPSNAQTTTPQDDATKTPSDANTPASANTTASSNRENSASLTADDRAFLEKAAQGGMTEVKLGKLASEKSASPKVKEFGARMVKDHGKADAKLKTIASAKGVDVPANLDTEHQASVDSLSDKSGGSFDKAYVDAMVKDHEQDAADFQREADSTQDPQVKAFATQTLKTVKMHLSMIKEIQQGM